MKEPRRRSLTRLQAIAEQKTTKPKATTRREPKIPKVTQKLVRRVLKAARG